MVQHSMQWLVTIGDLKIGILLGALLLLAALYRYQRSSGRDPGEKAQNGHTPLEQLQRRYVSGEIDEVQYKQMREELTHG